MCFAPDFLVDFVLCCFSRMYENDCKVCKGEVNNRSNSIACECCGDWYHTRCVGLKEASQKVLRNDFLIGLCPECLDTTRAWWEEKRVAKEEGGTDGTGEGPDPSSQGDVEVEGGATGAVTPQESDHSYSNKAVTDSLVTEGRGSEEVMVEKDSSLEEAGKEPKVQEEAKGGARSRSALDTPSQTRANSRGTQEANSKRGKEDQGSVGSRGRSGRGKGHSESAWMGIGRQSWRHIQDGKRLWLKTGSKVRRMWLFGDSLMRGVGKEIYSLSKGGYRVMDKSRPGANIRVIREAVMSSLHQMEPEDLVVVEGGGNGLEDIGGRETVRVMEEIVRVVERKTHRRPLVMCIPKRRDKEGQVFGRERRWVNGKVVERLEDWKCDGMQLWERMDWRQVWTQDGVHMSTIGKVWVAWNLVEWAQRWEEGSRE